MILNDPIYGAMREESFHFKIINGTVRILIDKAPDKLDVLKACFGYGSSLARFILNLHFTWTKELSPALNGRILKGMGSLYCGEFFMNGHGFDTEKGTCFYVKSIGLFFHIFKF